MSDFKLHKRKKREVWVTALSREKKFRIVDANTGFAYLGEDCDGISEFGSVEPITWPSRSAAEAFAKEQGWKVV